MNVSIDRVFDVRSKHETVTYSLCRLQRFSTNHLSQFHRCITVAMAGESMSACNPHHPILVIAVEPSNISHSLKKYPILVSFLKGRAVARNQLAKITTNPYLLYMDADIHFDDSLWAKILPAIERNHIIAYDANPILCTRIFGIPRVLFWLIDGFDESFDAGEDMEIGFKLLDAGYRIHKIPFDSVKHHNHKERYNWVTHFCVRARLALRYKKYQWLLPPKRKLAPLNPIITIFAFYRYIFANKRRGLSAHV